MFGLGGTTDRGGSIGQQVRDRIGSWQAHPFQNLLSTAAGGINPLLGQAAGSMFGRYNDRNFNNSAQQSYANGAQQGNDAEARSWERPVGGPLGSVEGGIGTPQGNPMQSGPQGFDTQTWSPASYANTMNPKPPEQSPFVDSILNSLGPNGPGMSGHPGGGDNSSGAGMQGSPGIGRGEFGMLPGGGMNGVMNGASSATLGDFAHAGLNGDWTALLQSHYGANGPNRIAAAR